MEEPKKDYLGTVATMVAVLMYVSYIPQIYGNLTGHQTNFLQPAVAALNGLLWVIYGARKTKKDWPIILANAPAIVFGLLTAVTALL